MPQQPATSTDRLSNVIQVIQLGRKTGVLTVERFKGSNFEQGILTFVNGRVTQASVGQYNGAAAFNALNAWGECRFTFTPSATAQITQPLPSITGYEPNYRDYATDPTLRIQAVAGEQATNGAGDKQAHTAAVGVPYPIRQYDEALLRIERMGLSRAHRRLFLLVDGHRPTPELVRLMGRGKEEVEALLRELERAGVIQQT